MDWMDDDDVGLKGRFDVNVLLSDFLVSHAAVIILISYQLCLDETYSLEIGSISCLFHSTFDGDSLSDVEGYPSWRLE